MAPVITFINERYAIEVADGANLRQAMLDNSIQVYRGFQQFANCRGKGLCGACRVDIEPTEHGSTRTLREKAKLLRGTQRLACQTQVTGDIRVTTYPKPVIDAQTVPISSPVPKAVQPPKSSSEL